MKAVNPYKEKIHQYPNLIKTRPEILAHPQVNYINLLQGSLPQLILEIGSGSGNHLIVLAENHPQAMVVGMELRYKRLVRTAQKTEKAGLTNLAVLQWDGNLFHTILKPSSLHQLHLNFPDPWVKKKYRHRRIFLGDFIERLAICLAPDGFFSLKTDHGEYFQSFLDELEKRHTETEPWFQMEEMTWDLYNSPWIDTNIQTEFEAMFIYKVKDTIKHLKLVKKEAIPQ